MCPSVTGKPSQIATECSVLKATLSSVGPQKGQLSLASVFKHCHYLLGGSLVVDHETRIATRQVIPACERNLLQANRSNAEAGLQLVALTQEISKSR